MENKKLDSLYKTLVDSLFECKESFTMEQLKTIIESKGVKVKDISTLVEFLLEKEMIINMNHGVFQVTVEKAFNNLYRKNK